MKSLNLIALVATVAVVAACSTDDKKGSIINDKTRASANRTANSKGQIPALTSKKSTAAAAATVEVAPVVQPSLVEAAFASYELMTNAGSTAFRANLQESNDPQVALEAGRQAIIQKMEEIGATNPEAVALALVMLSDSQISAAYYKGNDQSEAAHIASFNQDDAKVLNELSALIQARWNTEKTSAESKFASITEEINAKTTAKTDSEANLAIEEARTEQNAEAIIALQAEVASHVAAIESLNKDLLAQKALIGEYQHFLGQVNGMIDYVAARAEATTPAVDVPATDVPATDVPATDVPATDVPATDVPATDVPATDVPATSEESTQD